MITKRDQRPRMALVAILAVVALANPERPTFGQTSDRLSLDAIERIDVPEERLTDWLSRQGLWEPVPRDEFERLVSPLLPKPPGPDRAGLRHVRYAAVLVGDSLLGGHLSADLQGLSPQTSFVDLGEPSLAIDELSWSQGPAVWGTALDGRHWLKLDPTEKSLDGRWTARGRTLHSGVAFDLQLLPAAFSQIELLVPRGQTVAADVGDVLPPSDVGDGTTMRWRIDLGNQSRCRLIVSPPPRAASPAPTVLYEQELSVAVSHDVLLLQQILKADVLDGEVNRLIVSFPRQVEIVSAAYGDQSPLKFERIPGEGPSAQVVVVLPERLQGRSRPIRLDGYMRRSPSESLAVPHFYLEGGLWLDGRTNVTVARPWELRSYRAVGYRQLAPAALRPEAETISFQQLTPRAQLLLNVDRPPVERSAHALNVLTADDLVWTLTAEIAWESRNGTVFDASCRLPDGWQVVSVVPLGGGRERQELTSWDVQAHPESGQVLHMEFPEGLTPGRVDSVRIVSHRISSTPSPTHIPLMIPLDCESSEVVLVVDPSLSGELPLSATTALERFDPHTAAAVWNTLPSWSEVASGAAKSSVVLHLLTSDSAPIVSGDPARRTLDAVLQTSVAFNGQQVQEQFEIRFNAGDAVREIEIAAPKGMTGLTWSLRHEDTETLVNPQRVGRSRAASAPPGLESDLWSLALPEGVTGPTTLVGRRTVSPGRRYVVPLLLLPQVQRFQGRIALTVDNAEAYELTETRRSDSTRPPSTSDEAEPLSNVAREWTYRTWDREWILQRRDSAAAGPHLLQLELSSVLSAEGAAFDYHELTVAGIEDREFKELRFQLDAPAELQAVIHGSQTLPFSFDGASFTVSGWELSPAAEFRILYRVPAEGGLFRRRHRFIVPKFDVPYARFAWHACHPPGSRLSVRSLGLRLAPEAVEVRWYLRPFGPLARAPGEPWFPPLTGAEAAPAEVNGSLKSAATSTTRLSFPPGWSVSSTTDRFLPAAASFVMWDRHALRLATWMAMLACVPIGLVIRGSMRPWLIRLGAASLGAATGLSVFGPEGWNEIFGGACCGLILASIVPKDGWRLLQTSPPRMADPSTSTEIFRHAGAPIGLFLLMIGGLSMATAQDAARPYRVVVPVDRAQRPSRKFPVVYVSPELLKKLNEADVGASSDPTQLIRSATYIVHSDQQRRPILKIAYRIDRLAGGGRAELLVPLSRRWHSGLESVLVDGRPQSAVFTPDGRMLALSLTSAAGDDGPAQADRPLNAGFPERREVVLEIRLPAGIDAPEARFVADVFPVLDSRLVWQSSQSLGWFDLSAAKGAVSVSLDRRVVEAALGAAKSFEFRRSASERSRNDEAMTDVQLLHLLMLRPTLIQGTFRAEVRVIEGSPDRLEIELPVGAALREIRGHKVLKTSVVGVEGGGPRVILEFQEPQQQNFVVEGEYVLPRASADETVDYPRLRIRCGKPAGSARHRVAVACTSDFTAQMINLDDPTVLPIPIDQFVSQWGDTVPTQRPQFAFQVQEEGRPAFRLVSAPPEVNLVNWHETVAVTRRRLDWQLTAELKPSSPFLFSYSVLLDRRLTIDEVSVRENGADQLLRWSKTPMIGSSQYRLTVFLNRETTGTSQLTIRGNLRMRPASSIALPSVRFEAAQSAPGTLSLLYETGHRLVVEGRQQPLDGDGAAPAPSPDAVPLKVYKRLRIQEGDSGLSARLDPVAGACRARAVWFVEPASSAWRVRGWMELSPEDGTREISVNLPEWLAAAPFTTPDDGPPPSEHWDDNGLRLLVSCGENRPATRVLAWDVEIAGTDEHARHLQLPDVLQAVETETYAATARESSWTVSDESVVSAETLPGSLRDRLREWNADDVAEWSRLSGTSFLVLRTDGSVSGGSSSVALVEHILLETADGGWQGESEFYPSTAATTLDIAIPEGLDVVTIHADEETLPMALSPTSERTLHIDDARRRRVITVRWTAPAAGSTVAPLSWAKIPLPNCGADSPAKVMMTIRPAGDVEWLFSRNVQRRGEWQLAFDRLGLLLKRRQQQGMDAADVDLSRVIWREYRAAAARLPLQDGALRLSDDDRRRWAEMSQAVSQIASPPDERIPVETAPLSAGGSTGTVFGELPSDANEVGFWTIRRAYLDGVAVGLIVLLGAWLLPALVRLQYHPWLEGRTYAGWFVFGLAWWLCFSPAIVGIAAMAWAVFGQFWRRPRLIVNQ